MDPCRCECKQACCAILCLWINMVSNKSLYVLTTYIIYFGDCIY